MTRKLPEGEGKRVPLNMRTTRDIRDRLEAAAKSSGRSLAQEVEFRLQQSFADSPDFDADLFVENAFKDAIKINEKQLYIHLGGKLNYLIGLKFAEMLNAIQIARDGLSMNSPPWSHKRTLTLIRDEGATEIIPRLIKYSPKAEDLDDW